MKERKRALLPVLLAACLGSSPWILLLLRAAACSGTAGAGAAAAGAGDPPSPRGGPKAHPHAGKVAPFASGDPGIRLDAAALRVLGSGHPYKTQVQSGPAGGRGMVVQDVDAPAAVVWDRILDFEAYPRMVPKTIESQVYRRERLGDGTERIWVRMKIGFPPVLKLQFFVNHLHDPARNSLTWTLDYTTPSDLDDSVGFWYVVPHPDDPLRRSRVYYSVQVSMFPWVPSFVVDFMSKQALADATAWVKRHSEREAARLGPAPLPSPAAPAADGGAAEGPTTKASGRTAAALSASGRSPAGGLPALAVQKRGWWGARNPSGPPGAAVSSCSSLSEDATREGSPGEVADRGGAAAAAAAVADDGWLRGHRVVLASTAIAALLYAIFVLLFRPLR